MGKGSNAQKNKRARENAMKRAASQGDGGGGAAGIAQRKGGGESARLEKEKLRRQKEISRSKIGKRKEGQRKGIKEVGKKVKAPLAGDPERKGEGTTQGEQATENRETNTLQTSRPFIIVSKQL